MAKKRTADTAGTRMKLSVSQAEKIRKPTPSRQAMIDAIKRDNVRNKADFRDENYDKKRDVAQQYVESGRMTPDKLKSKLGAGESEIHMAGWRQERRRDAKDVSGEAARQDKIAQKNIQRNQSRQGNQESNRKGGGKKLTLSSKQRLLQAIKNRK